MRAALILSVLLLTACGSTEPPTPAAMAEKIGCTDYQPKPTDELYVRDSGVCTVDGRQVRLLTFADNEARDSFAEIAEAFGLLYVKADAALYEAKDPAHQEAVRARVED